MTQPLLLKSIMLCAAVFVASSCDKDVTPNEETPLNMEITIVRNLPPGESADEATYYSLETGMQIPSTEANTNKWDIAFLRTTILINSGSSGPGSGSAQVISGIFDEIITAPTDGYAVDNAPTSYAIPTGSGNGWYSYNPVANIITPIAGKVIILRTASGKYAKLEMLSYYKDAPPTPSAGDTSRYYTFRYLFQSDGSTKLQ